MKNKKKVDWMNGTIVSHTEYDFELIKRMYNPETDIVKLLNQKWKKGAK